MNNSQYVNCREYKYTQWTQNYKIQYSKLQNTICSVNAHNLHLIFTPYKTTTQ